jgi:hypothetical protein
MSLMLASTRQADQKDLKLSIGLVTPFNRPVVLFNYVIKMLAYADSEPLCRRDHVDSNLVGTTLSIATFFGAPFSRMPWFCSIRLFKYFDERSMVRVGNCPCC